MMKLNKIHCQRIGVAADAARRGTPVTFWVSNGAIGGARLLCGVGGGIVVIANGGRAAMEGLLPQAQEEFRRQMQAELATA